MLLQCYYEKGRYETIVDLAKSVLAVDSGNACFANNYYICYVLQHIRETVFPSTALRAGKSENPFLNYNMALLLESDLSHSYDEKPTLKSKLLFMNYRFNKFSPATI